MHKSFVQIHPKTPELIAFVDCILYNYHSIKKPNFGCKRERMIKMAKDTRTVKDAVYLIDDNNFWARFEGFAPSGWDMDKRCRTKPDGDVRGVFCTDGQQKYDVYAKKEIVPSKSGKIGYASAFQLDYGDGFYIRFCDGAKNKKIALEIAADGGLFTVNGNKIPVLCEKRTYYIDVSFDLDKSKAEVFIDETSYGTFKLKTPGLTSLIYGVRADRKTSMSPMYTRMWINYLFVDRCLCGITGKMPSVWEFSSKGNAEALRSRASEGICYSIISADKKKSTLSRKFEKSTGKVCFEMKYNAVKCGIAAEISLTSGRKSIVTVADCGDAISCGDQTLRSHHPNVWQTLRIEADIPNGTALVCLNGKKCGTFALAEGTKSVDGIKIEYSSPDGGVFKLTDLSAFVINPEPADYVPAPVLPEKRDYCVGMNICSLWREGSHFGWDVISPYRENETYMGYYDEGLPEVADWEIKWMLEHGIDFELYCWYNNQVNAPIIGTRLSSAIHDGHFKAKYGDMMKFAFIWEAMNCAHPTIEGFRNHIVPYWMDYFFSDHRYFTIENKILISVFGAEYLIKDFGSPEAVAEQFDYVRQQVKTLGYDGAIFIACGEPSERVKTCGFDAVYAYNWGKEGCSPEYTKGKIMGQRKKNIMHVVPTVSTGFNKIGWGDDRTGLMSCEDMGEMFRWIKEDILPTNTGSDEWKKKFVMLSTWNEYGEGTYMCPAGLNGFGYLDEVRRAFTYAPDEHTDVRPTEAQKERLGYLYPKNRHLLRSEQLMPKKYPDEPIEAFDMSADKWQTVNGLEIHDDGGKIVGKASEFDPQMIMSVDVDPSVVKNVRVTMKSGNIGETICLYFTTDTDGVWTESKGAKATIRPTNNVYNLNVGAVPTWKGRITGFRLDPISGEGDFEIESIELLTDTKSIILSIDGEVCRTREPVELTDGDVYVPFEHASHFASLFYDEWDRGTQTLHIIYDDKDMYFTLGKDYVLVNGKKIKLPEALRAYDGLPMIHLGTLCEICGISYSVDGRNVNIVTR